MNTILFLDMLAGVYSLILIDGSRYADPAALYARDKQHRNLSPIQLAAPSCFWRSELASQITVFYRLGIYRAA